jgi:DNA-binding transcriptional regulator YiaG
VPLTPKKTPNPIRKLRIATGMTQPEFAAEFGVSLRTVSRWEKGTTKPSYDVMDRAKKLAK